VVDQWTGFSAATDTFDGVHPVDSGFRKMADRWYPAVAAAVGGTTTPDDPPPPGDCTADYRVTGRWQDGFQGEVTVHNGGTTAMTGWTVTFTFGGGERITQSWNATVTQSGADVTARNAGWNGAIAPGASTAFGFLGSATGTGAPVTASCAPA
jgi:cellulase/cellobiase CelA1